MTKPWLHHLHRVLCGWVLGLGLLGPASAIIVTTNYDPPFGAGPLDGYGWKATINYEIPAECFTTAGLKINFFGLVLGCEAPRVADFKVLSAQVGIYGVANPDFLLDVLTFNPNSLPLGAVVVQPPDTLAQVYALTPSNIVQGNQPFDDDIQFRLRLWGASAEVEYRSCAAGARRCPGWTTAPPPTQASYTRYAEGTPFSEVFAQTELRLGGHAVPVPGTLALALLALGAGVAVQRRRSVAA